jgi:hypothetical protein
MLAGHQAGHSAWRVMASAERGTRSAKPGCGWAPPDDDNPSAIERRNERVVLSAPCSPPTITVTVYFGICRAPEYPSEHAARFTFPSLAVKPTTPLLWVDLRQSPQRLQRVD